MKIRPLGHRVLIKKTERKKEGALILTNEAPVYDYEVLEVGEKVTAVASGDKVILSPYGGVNFGEPDMVIVKEEEILCKECNE